ncbi:MAG: hypothetical protein QOG97_964 [Acidimicrobiaceae bacterium]|nr:hypothetical protein [Acidimicrobiaceae bacterium]
MLGDGALDRLWHALGEHGPSIVGNERRYSLQLRVNAIGEAEALFSASARWKDATRRLGLPAWQLARAEVVTVKEFQGRTGAASPSAPAPSPPVAPHLAPDDLLPRALQDSLTGLVNRDLFADCLRSVLVDDTSACERWAVLVIDLDKFGSFNESEGPAVADRLLAVLAARISRIPEHAMVARLGGDEFAVLVCEMAPGDVERIADRLLETIRTPATVAGRQVTVTASVGFATNANLRHPDDLIRDAAVAMCVAKQDGRNCARRFETGTTVDIRRLDFDADPAPDRLAHVLLLERAALAANDCQTLEEAAAVVLQQVCAHTSWPLGHLGVVAGSGEWVVPTAIWHSRGPDNFGPFRTACNATTLGLGQGLAGRALQSKEFACFAEFGSATGLPDSIASTAVAAGITCGCAFPVLVGIQVVAVLEFYCTRSGRVSEALREVMRGVCAQLGRVAERSQAQAALARSEEKYHTLADAVPVLMWLTGLDGNVKLFNKAWLEFTGLTLEEELAGRGVARMHPDDLGRCLAGYRQAYEQRQAVATYYRLKRADGEYRIIFGEARPVGSGDDFQGFVGAGIDVTEWGAARKPHWFSEEPAVVPSDSWGR